MKPNVHECIAAVKCQVRNNLSQAIAYRYFERDPEFVRLACKSYLYTDLPDEHETYTVVVFQTIMDIMKGAMAYDDLEGALKFIIADSPGSIIDKFRKRRANQES